ncbi:LytTR family DNA-binding domain-containing protein [uncultured Algibacter sp.]|uniref:LytTR family DNA-binding domain-containing protein n=1 Tax=uncultured Algibacter sp. TaxID=298659 RepID=UPI00262B0B13|nr:LytTR family DNA-binding domain-containing protein [uncultured Algibacter sp.]
MKIKVFLKQPFDYFDSNKNKWIYVIGATAFAITFLVLFQPYGLSEEVSNPENTLINLVLFFLSVALSTFLTLSFSQFFARKWFGFENVSIKKYVTWYIFEALGLTLVSFGFSFIVPDLGNDFEKELNLVFQLKIFFKVIVVLVFPFVGSIIYVLIQNLNYEISELGEQLSVFKSNFDMTQETELLEIKDENDNIDFSVELKNFLYAESSNQYILIHYLKEEKVKKHITRNRMKSFLIQTENFPIKQCHRSYAVNLLNVDRKAKEQGKDFLINSKIASLKVPISKSYLSIISNEVLPEKAF